MASLRFGDGRIAEQSLGTLERARENRVPPAPNDRLRAVEAADELRTLLERSDGRVPYLVDGHSRRRQRRDAIVDVAKGIAVRACDVSTNGRPIALRELKRSLRELQDAEDEVAHQRYMRKLMERARFETGWRRVQHGVQDHHAPETVLACCEGVCADCATPILTDEDHVVEI